MAELNVGIVGTGFIGPAHLEALRRNNINVVGLAEATPALAKAKAAELEVKKGYELVRSPNRRPANPGSASGNAQLPAFSAGPGGFAGRKARYQ